MTTLSRSFSKHDRVRTVLPPASMFANKTGTVNRVVPGEGLYVNLDCDKSPLPIWFEFGEVSKVQEVKRYSA